MKDGDKGGRKGGWEMTHGDGKEGKGEGNIGRMGRLEGMKDNISLVLRVGRATWGIITVFIIIFSLSLSPLFPTTIIIISHLLLLPLYLLYAFAVIFPPPLFSFTSLSFYLSLFFLSLVSLFISHSPSFTCFIKWTYCPERSLKSSMTS